MRDETRSHADHLSTSAALPQGGGAWWRLLAPTVRIAGALVLGGFWLPWCGDLSGAELARAERFTALWLVPASGLVLLLVAPARTRAILAARLTAAAVALAVALYALWRLRRLARYGLWLTLFGALWGLVEPWLAHRGRHTRNLVAVLFASVLLLVGCSSPADRLGLPPPQPDIPAATWLARAREAAAAGAYDRAVRYTRHAIAVAPEHAAPYLQLGRYQEAAGLVTEAEMAYRAAVAVDPRFTPARIQLGWLLFRTGRLEAVLDLLPSRGDPAALHLRGAVLLALGRPQVGVALLRDTARLLDRLGDRVDPEVVADLHCRLAHATHPEHDCPFGPVGGGR